MIQAPITLLVVTAVEAERDAIADAIADELSRPTARAATIQLLIGGVGPAAAAATTADALARLAAAGNRPDVVLCAGIGGGFAPTVLGEVVVASSVVFADLGAETPAGFTELAQLGFGRNHYPVPARVAAELSGRTGARAGTILTVSTVTGSAATAHQLRLRYPDAVAEAMEGAGVAAAAQLAGVAFAELRAISNVVGPRDRDAWQIPGALAALGRALAAIAGAPSWTL